MSANRFQVGLVQMAMSRGPGREHRRRRRRGSPRRPDAAPQVVCLPELFRTPYFCQTETHAHFDLAEPVRGPSAQALARGGAGGTAWRWWSPSSSGGRRGSTTTAPSSSTPTARVAGLYRKMHIPDDPAFYEKFYFTPGDLGFKAFDTTPGRIGTLICWDQWYPEAARLTALAGRRGALLPDRHRLAPGREGRVRRGPARRLADHPARPTPSPTAATWRR